MDEHLSSARAALAGSKLLFAVKKPVLAALGVPRTESGRNYNDRPRNPRLIEAHPPRKVSSYIVAEECDAIYSASPLNKGIYWNF